MFRAIISPILRSNGLCFSWFWSVGSLFGPSAQK